MPAAAYKPLHASGLPVTEPMVITGKHIFQSSRQITAQALCKNCEDRFNVGGEAWTLDNPTTPTALPLRDMVRNSRPMFEEPDFAAFSSDQIPDFKVEKLVHFALGLLWKSA